MWDIQVEGIGSESIFGVSSLLENLLTRKLTRQPYGRAIGQRLTPQKTQ
jgi:hypothetical protein